MKKTIVILLAVVLVSWLIVSCKPAVPVTEETTPAVEETTAATETTEVTLRVADWQSGNEGILKSYNVIIKKFEQEHSGVKINYEQFAFPTYNQMLKPAIAGGTAPDIFEVYQGPDLVEVVKAGALIDLKDKVDEEWKSWLGSAYDFQGAWVDEGLYLIPVDVWTEALWYHKDMLKEIGYEPPKSTDQFSVEDYIKMVDPAKKKGYDVIIAGFAEAWSLIDAFFNFVHQQQKSPEPDMVLQAMNGEVSWQQDIFRNAIDVFVKLNDAEVWRKDVWGFDTQVQEFGKWLERESIFIWAQGDWFASAMKPEENNPENPNIGIIQYPRVNDDSHVVFNKNFGIGMGVYSKGKNQELSLEFLRMLNTPDFVRLQIMNGSNPAAIAGLKGDIPETGNPIFDECIKLYTSPGEISEVYYNNPEAVKALGDGIANVVLKTQTIDEVLKQLDGICGYRE
ncbi:MAG: extracellular solute-binding protein [Actinobacteria bacterium]|nr:extracellular solute-binding protein [Actinomycetota bacterium]